MHWIMRWKGGKKKSERGALKRVADVLPVDFDAPRLHPWRIAREIFPSVCLRSEDLHSAAGPYNPESDSANTQRIFVRARGITAIAVYYLALDSGENPFSLFLSLPFREFGARTATIDGQAATDALKLSPGAFKPRLMRIAPLKAGWNGFVYGHYIRTREYNIYIHTPFPATVRSMHTTE